MSTDSSTLAHKNSENTNSNNSNSGQYSSSHYLPSPISPTSIAISSGSTNPFVLALDQLKSLPTTDNSTRSEPKTRTRLEQELEQIRTSSSEAQQTYHTVHTSIQEYQQLVLSTHAQVAAAKQSLIKARESLSQFQSQSSSNGSSSVSPTSTSTSTSSPSLSRWTTKTANYSSPSTPQTSKNSHPRPISSPDETRSNTLSRRNIEGSDISNQPQCEKENEDDERSESDVALQQQVLRDKAAHVHQLEQDHAELGGRLSQLLSDKAEAEETKKKLSDGLWKAKARIKDIERQLRE
ncbi:hypothetical protein BG011_000946 [Mortierella polycephala]|uniref:Uncharacterized protein n=1 Tax=Mortierella polycephala TaxID=41804 RepID=A0A9P6Q6C6_9FUNG|nr:hypothetical protein BG011_000946 [Mortierella polycephala]